MHKTNIIVIAFLCGSQHIEGLGLTALAISAYCQGYDLELGVLCL